MNKTDSKRFYIDVKDLSLEKDQYIEDLLRFLTEQLPQIELSQSTNNIEIVLPQKMSKRTIKLRLKKFLHQKSLNEKFRPISYKNQEKEGYMIKERKNIELAYY